MHRHWIYVFILLCLTCFLPGELHAQFTPAWTRKLTPALWQNLVRNTRFIAGEGIAPFIAFPRTIDPAVLIKSTDWKFIYHKVYYSGVFSRAEKDLLLRPNYEQATLGKLTYIHDKHAAFFNNLNKMPAAPVSQQAFWKHQNTLEELLRALETHYLVANQKKFASKIFSSQEIARLQANPTQPAAYLLTAKELNYFSQLPTLAEQQQWVSIMVDYLQKDIRSLLQKDTFRIRPVEFERYYVQNVRLDYFKTLTKVLARADKKRPSAIMRLKLPLSGQTQPLTDAQRAGYLQFMHDTQQGPSVDELTNFNENYGPYAVAEALEVPYEIALQYGMYAPELLGEVGARLRQLPPQSCLDELSSQIEQLEEDLARLREHPSHTPQFYVSYYQVYAKQKIYKTLTARAKALSKWDHE